MSSNYSLATDLKEAQAMAQALGDYVHSDPLYGQAGGGFFSKMPSLTVGALLMRLRRLNELRDQLNQRQQDNLTQAISQWQSVRDEWRVHYEEKVQREIASRIDAMAVFFRECSDSMARCAQVYRPELLRRTIVQELLREANTLNLDNSEFRESVQSADAKLRGFLTVTEFQWSEELQGVYPQTEFWWLYARPQATDK